MRSKIITMSILAALTLAACGGGEAEDSVDEDPAKGTKPAAFATPYTDAAAYPVFVSSEITVGENRFLIGLLDDNDAPIGSPEVSVEVAYFDLEASTDEPAFTEKTEFVWIVEEQGRGLYVAHPEFTRAGMWGAEVSISGDGLDESLKGSFEVAAEPSTPAVGDKVPASDTATIDEVADLSDISTDDDPEQSFYETSIKEAVKKGEPFVAVFATPKYCTSAVCGPTLDDVETVAKDFPNVTFIHTEIYKDLEPTNPPIEPVIEWGLPSEPWVFVVDSEGRLVAKFEGSAPAQELRPVLESLR